MGWRRTAGLLSAGSFVIALAACSSSMNAQREESSQQASSAALPELVAPFQGETPFAFALAADTLDHADVEQCKDLIEGHATWATVVVTKAADGFVFAADRVPSASEVADVERAVRACDVGLAFSLARAGENDDRIYDVEPVGGWAPLQSGDTDGLRWTVYRADANPNIDGTANACYSVEVTPSAGPAVPTTTITYPGDKSLRGLTMSCQSPIGPKPERPPAIVRPGTVFWQPMQVLWSDTSDSSYVGVAGLVAPQVDRVRVEGVDLPVVEQTFVWLSRDTRHRPVSVELPALRMQCRLEDGSSRVGDIVTADCPLIPAS